jgi:hypothetical protein
MLISEMKLKSTDKAKLTKLKSYLEQAQHGYLVGMDMKTKLEIESIYNKYYNEHLSIGCSKCMLKMVQKCAELYFKED